MNEVKNDYKIKFGPYEVELKNDQVYFRKNNSLVKAIPVKSTFGLYDLKIMVKKIAKKVNMTNKLPKDVLKANVNEAKDQKLAKLFQRSIKASAKDGEDKLYKLSQDWEDWNVDNDDQYDDLLDPLFAAVELVQDAGVPGTNNVEDDKEYRMYIKSADKHLKTFNRDVKKAMKLHKESVNEKRDLLQGDLEEVVVMPGKSYKKLRYKVKDVNKFKGALVNFTKQTKIKVDLKNDGSGHFSLNGNFNPKDADKLDLIIQKTGAELTLAESKMEKKMKKSEKNLREAVRAIAKPLLEAADREIGAGGEEVTSTGFETEGKLTEGEYVLIDPRGNPRPVGSKMQASQYAKKMGGPKKGYHIVLKKNALKARRAIEKNGGNATNSKIQNTMFDLMYEGTTLESFIKEFKESNLEESSAEYGKTLKRLAADKQLKNITAKDKETLLKIVRLVKTANESTGELTEATRSDLQIMQAALKGIKAARVGNSAGATYLKSLKNSWRLDPKSKKDYMNFTTDDWEEDVLNYIQNKR